MKKTIEIALLLGLVGLLGYYVYQRTGMRMGGTPSSIQSRFASEEHWMVETILRDLAEVAAFARGVPPGDVRLDYELLPAGPLELPPVRVAVRIGSVVEVARELHLERSFWTPGNYAPLAAELLGPGLPEDGTDDGAILDALLEPTLPVLLSENDRVTASLRSNVRNPLAHEEAAVLLGVFGMREAAYGFDDKRLLLLRMTTHLALARALRGEEPPGPTGSMAEAALLALCGRQAELWKRLDGTRGASRAAEAWKSALYLYSTEDWRREAMPEELLVKLMRFRAMVSSLGASAAIDRMGDALDRDVSDWGRILTWLGSGGVASSSFVEEQPGRELAEANEVALAYHGAPLSPRDLSAALNELPGGIVGEDGPEALGWGLWAAFHQRHLLGAILAGSRMYRDTFGLPDAAEAFGREADFAFAELEMNPIVQVRRTRYVGGRVEDTIGMDGAIALARKHPELVSPTNWRSLEDTAAHMMRKRGMPRAASWLSPRVLVTGALDGTEHRLEIFELARAVDATEVLEALSSVAPSHSAVSSVLAEHLKRRTAEDLYSEMSERLESRLDFDLHALRTLLEAAKGEDGRLRIFERMCAIDATECADLGWELVYWHHPEEAAAAFEKLVDAAPSGVYVCNNANWLVNYYYEDGRRDEALALAEEAAAPYCSWGLRTHAHLLERIGQVAQAERLYQMDAERYEYDAPVAPPLLGFYYRRARLAGDIAFEERFEAVLSRVFPRGLEPLSDVPGDAPPTDGVFIDGASPVLEREGLRGGDVIVGLDGWRVHTLDQYDAVASFRDRTSNARDMRIRIWRQARYMDLEADALSRSFHVRVRTFGTPGPSYQWR